MVKKIFSKLKLFFCVRTSDQKRKYLIGKGCKIGIGTRILGPVSCFGTEPYLIEVGENCLFSNGMNFFTHDGGVSVLNNLNKFEDRMDKIGRIKVGNNVYIGCRAIILPNVNIGDNVVIGAGAIVTKDIPSNYVVAGCPAKLIMTIDEYYDKCKDKVYCTAGFTEDSKRKYFEKDIL